MKLLKGISVLVFLILLSTSCTHSGSMPVNPAYDTSKNKISPEAANTWGKTGNADITERGFHIPVHNIRSVISSVLDGMIEAYKNRDIREFMSYVGDDFAGDVDILKMAIQRDFSFFNNIDLRYVLNTLSADTDGKIFVTLTYNRSLVSTRSGESFTDHGTTAFVFHPGPDHPLVYSMKNPLLFGLSNATEVATGTVITSGDNSAIVVDDRGNLAIKEYGNLDNH